MEYIDLQKETSPETISQQYRQLGSKGIGRKNAELFLSWAEWENKRGSLEKAIEILEVAIIENVEPVDSLISFKQKLLEKKSTVKRIPLSERPNPLIPKLPDTKITLDNSHGTERRPSDKSKEEHTARLQLRSGRLGFL